MKYRGEGKFMAIKNNGKFLKKVREYQLIKSRSVRGGTKGSLRRELILA